MLNRLDSHNASVFKAAKLVITAITALVCGLQPAAAHAAPQACLHFNIHNSCGSGKVRGNEYAEGLIKLAFSYSDATYSFTKSYLICSQKREAQLVKQDNSSLLWAATKPELETELIPIRIPIYKGLLGVRLAVIRKQDQPNFLHVNNLDDLKRFTVGQGSDWSDTLILKDAGFSVITASDIHKLYNMLEAKRFDMLPRGVMEPWGELREVNGDTLAIEQSLVIAYPMPAYIFVSPHQPELAAIIEAGLNKAIADGSFDNYFFNDELVKEALNKAMLENRKLFSLPNPYLPEATPLNNKSLWLDVLTPLLDLSYL